MKWLWFHDLDVVSGEHNESVPGSMPNHTRHEVSAIVFNENLLRLHASFTAPVYALSKLKREFLLGSFSRSI